jgi:hypothetical protein
MARFSISNALQGGMSGAGAAAPASGGNPWIIGGGAALGMLSSFFGDEETPTDKISRQLMGEQLTSLKMSNRENAREAANRRKLESRNKTIGAGLGNLMRGANVARKLGGF